MNPGDTIFALSTNSGYALRMILRLSGPDAFVIAQRFVHEPFPRQAAVLHTRILIDRMSLPAWIYTFVAPKSYSGEDVVEFHLPGNPLLSRMLMKEMLGSGARSAEPGEFTARAYFNGRMDLTAAEGVAAIIAAGNEQELSAARRLLSGELSRRVGPVLEALADALALLEVGIDFSDEEVTFISAADVSDRIDRADAALSELLSQSARFERLSHEPTVVLVGRPNAGKSTLLNALAGHDRAVVSPIAGTTRDALIADVALDRGVVRLIDVAGLEVSQTGNSLIDRKMRAHALRAAEEADHLVLVRDAIDREERLPLPRRADLVVRSKSDLPGAQLSEADPEDATYFLSAQTGDGMEAFRDVLDRLCFGESTGGSSLALNARHVRAIEEARTALRQAKDQLTAGPEFIAHDLRQALDALGSITGKVSADDLLGRIFSAFCIGK